MVKEGLKYLFSASVFFLFSLPISAQQNPAEYMDNELIIKFRSEETAFNFKAKAARLPQIFYLHNIEVKDAIWKPEFENRLTSVIQAKGKVAVIPDFQGLRNVHKATFNSDVDALELAQLISELPEVEYAEPRFLYMTELVTNDPIQNDFVSFHNFNEAWDLVSNSSDVIISIVDSGVNYGHEDLDEKHWLNEGEIPNNGLDDDGNGYIDDYLGWDFFDQAPDGSIIEDNNPFGTFSPHGTHVAGISTAIHDNELGLAGAGLNARFMAVKAGGIQDDPSTGVDESRQIGAGYEGILYSVINGADIINCSWGGGGISSFGEEVVNLARASGALVIASAGNDATDTESFPAAFENVLAVGALGNGSSIANYSNFGEYVDVFASGTIRSSVGTSTTGYATFNGTSMAAPVVSGLAALVKVNDPALTPEQIINQIKNTSISIEAQNPPSFVNKLGAGRIDAARAVGPLFPNIFVLEERYVDESGGTLGINEQGVMQITFSNSGGTTEDLSITISSQSSEIIIPESTINIGILETGAETTVEVPIFLNEALLDSLTGDILIETEDPGIDYSTSRILVYDRLLFSVSSANNLAMSFSGNGNIGFYDPLNASGGIGFVPDHQTANFFRANLLYEGGIIMAANNTVINNVRALEGQPYDQDFRPLEFYNVESPGSISDADGTAIFTSRPESNIPNVEITLNTYAFDQTSTSNSILLNYIVKNNSNSLSLSEVYLGLFNDWNIGEIDNNNVDYNSENDVLIVSERGDTENPVVSVATMANTSSVLAIDNTFEGFGSGTRFGTFDGFSEAEKRFSLFAEQQNTSVSGTDVSAVVATGPYFIPPDESISVGFIYAFGETDEELIDQINAARALNAFTVSELNSNINNSFPSETSLFQNYPNPFNPSTTFNFTLGETQNVELSIYNVLGQKVRTVINTELSAGIHNLSVSFNELAGGLYFAVLETSGKRELIKLTLIK